MEHLKDKLELLLTKSEWTEEEQQWLLNYLENTETNELRDILQKQFGQGAHSESELSSGLSAKMLESIHKKIGVTKTRNPTDVIRRFAGIAAAASVIGFFLFGAYLLSGKEGSTNTAQKTEISKSIKNDVLPGGNKATLTLADGSIILLDDVQNGEVAKQGATTVIKLDGKLNYRANKIGSADVGYNTIATPRGGQYQIMLADGSSVWLNAASSLRFPTAFAGKERRVEITGEAYLEVAKNKAMPFIVSVDDGAEVQVLGTHFNVMAYKDEASIKTTLLEGAVHFVKGNNIKILKPGQQSQLGPNGEIIMVNNVDVEDVVAWKNGYFHFEGEDIGTVIRQLSRWYDVEVLETRKINEKFYAEIPRNTKLSDALRALELTGAVRFTLEGKKIVIR